MQHCCLLYGALMEVGNWSTSNISQISPDAQAAMPLENDLKTEVRLTSDFSEISSEGTSESCGGKWALTFQ